MTINQAEQVESDLPAKIGAPARRALATVNCLRLEHVAAFSEAELKQLHGMGPKAIGLLREALAAKGLAFADKQSGSARSRP